jgi:hypothetical protein
LGAAASVVERRTNEAGDRAGAARLPAAERLDKAWEAKGKGWTVVDMKDDWKKVFAFD